MKPNSGVLTHEDSDYIERRSYVHDLIPQLQKLPSVAS